MDTRLEQQPTINFQGPGHLPGHRLHARLLLSEIRTILFYAVFGALVADSAAESGTPPCIIKGLRNSLAQNIDPSKFLQLVRSCASAGPRGCPFPLSLVLLVLRSGLKVFRVY